MLNKKASIKKWRLFYLTYTTYCHSFATNAIRSGASIELISKMLSHSSIMTTKNYFAGFESDEKRNISNKLMDF